MIHNQWNLGKKDATDLYRILRKAGILQSTVAGEITGATLDIRSTYLVKERKHE